MSAPGFLAVSGVELVNNARTLAYLSRGLGGPVFETVTGTPCPDLIQEAWPLAGTICPATSSEDDLATDPLGSTYLGIAGAAPAGWVYSSNAGGELTKTTTALSAIVPASEVVNQFDWDVTLTFDYTVAFGALDTLWIGRGLHIADATYPTLGEGIFGGLQVNAGQMVPYVRILPPGTGGVGTAAASPGSGFTPVLGNRYWLRASIRGRSVITVSIYSGDPENGSQPMTTWQTDASVTLAAQLIGLGVDPTTVLSQGGVGLMYQGFANGQTVPPVGFKFKELQSIPICTGRSALADLFPEDGLWPADDLYPAMYGEFHDPGTDQAPWVDADRPESYGFLGILVDSIDGLDATSNRSMDSAADGVGGILGPENLDPRDIIVKGWLIADGCSSMEYARRWLGDTLSGHLCSGCDAAYVDVRTTCGDDDFGDFYTNRWRIYDVGLASLDTDVADQSVDCCYVTPVTFKLVAADPYLYGPQVVVQGATLLNADGQEAPPIPFESWLFNQETPVCVSVVDQGIGIDAAIFTFYGGTSGIEAGVVYPSLGTYPADSLYPDDCLFPSDGSTQWGDCPFAFTFSIGPGESFVVDNSRRLLQWILPDGTILNGAPKMNLNAGDVIQWIDTCAGASIDACAVAYAACTCDETATVSVATQHRER